MSGETSEGEAARVGPSAGLGDRIAQFVELLRGTDYESQPFRPATDGPLASFDHPPGHREVDRYWVNAPYAYVVVTYDREASEHQYHVVEPDVDEFTATLLERVRRDIRNPLLYRDDADPTSEATLRAELSELIGQYGVALDNATFHTMAYYLYRDFRGYGRVDPLMRDPHIEDISCDGYDLPIFVYHDTYTDIETNVVFDREELDHYVVRMAQRSGRHISIGDPVIGTTLPNGSRAELVLGEEVTPRGSAFTLRMYADEPFTPIDLIDYGTFSVEQMAYLWLCIEHNKSLIFAGGTASGKTTSMNAVSMFIPPRAKVLSIEDTRELSLYHDNWLSSVTRQRLNEGTDIDMYDLLRSALRHRPEYIIVGEVRGEEAVTLFQAMNTGHTTFSTMHADSVETVINRLENEPINVPRPMIQSLDLLLVQTLTRLDDERVRRSKAIGEIGEIDQRTGELDYANAFSWDAEDDAFDRHDSTLLAEIRRDRGWTQAQARGELRNRERFLRFLSDRGVTDYRKFTALVNEYYAHPDEIMERIDETDAGPDVEIGSDAGTEAASGVDAGGADADTNTNTDTDG